MVFRALFQVDLGTCEPNDAGWANVDMDSLGSTNADGSTTGQSISIEFHTKEAHRDEDECKITSSTDCPQGENVPRGWTACRTESPR